MSTVASASPRFRAPASEPAIARWLFGDVRSAPIWLVIRLWLGWSWLSSGWGKLQIWDFANGSWLANNGRGLKGFWDKALVAAPGEKGAIITYDWYYDFLKLLNDNQAFTWFAWLIVIGEIAVGLGLLTGTLTGVAAFFGLILNLNFLLAGTTSSNPVLLLVALFVIMAWRVAGWWGLDRFVLPAIGTPWNAGALFSHDSNAKDNARFGNLDASGINLAAVGQNGRFIRGGLGLIGGIWLLVSPSLMYGSVPKVAADNASLLSYIVGVAAIILALVCLAGEAIPANVRFWSGMGLILLGIVLMSAPYLFNYSKIVDTLITLQITGAAFILVAGFTLQRLTLYTEVVARENAATGTTAVAGVGVA